MKRKTTKENVYLYKNCDYVFLFHSIQSSFVGAIAIGDLVKSTLGPKGMVSSAAL